jgi:hypothetical protein
MGGIGSLERALEDFVNPPPRDQAATREIRWITGPNKNLT